MSYANGKVPASALTTVFPNAQLLNPVALSVKTLVHVGALEGIRVTAVDQFYCGYRSLAVQKIYWDAAHGNKTAAAQAGIDPNMRVNMGAVGAQSHGTADRIDLSFNGTRPDSLDLALVTRYGGVQEFGSDDPHHFRFTGNHTGVSETDKNRIVAHWLNGQSMGETTTTDRDGVWPATECHFSRMLQIQGRKDKLYPAPLKVDGIRGTRTAWLRDHYLGVLFK